jgi:hypothetical protein
VHEAPVPLLDVDSKISATLAGIVMRCLLKDPLARYQTGRELADALLEFLHEVNAHVPERARVARAEPEKRPEHKTTTG